MNYLTLRQLAKTPEYQNLFVRAKEINGIRIFKNEYDFTFIQQVFLYYLEMYHNLYQDLYMKEPLISESVINDVDRCDAYLYWKQKNKSNPKSKAVKTQDLENPGAIVFKGKRK